MQQRRGGLLMPPLYIPRSNGSDGIAGSENHMKTHLGGSQGEGDAITGRRMRRELFICLLLGLCLWMTKAALAQSTFGTIRGTVQDATGAIVPGADVVIHSIQENTDRTTKTDDAGEFSVQNLKPGAYRISVHHDGFSDAQVSSTDLSARQELRLPFTLGVASQSTVVQVEASAAQINTENAVLSDEKNNVQITQLP